MSVTTTQFAVRRRLAQVGAALSGLALVLGASACSVADAGAVVRDTTASVSREGDSRAALADVTYLAECLDDQLLQRPSTFTLACGDGNEYLDRLTWNGWGDDSATATGVLVSNDCDPTCVDGSDVEIPVRVVANRLVLGEASAVYRTLTVTATGEVRTWLDREQVIELPGPQEMDPALLGEDSGHES